MRAAREVAQRARDLIRSRRAARSEDLAAQRLARAAAVVEASTVGVPVAVLTAAAAVLAIGASASLDLAAVAAMAVPVVARGLHVGTADPHGLKVGDGAWREPRRRFTFSVLAHEAPRSEELMARSFAPTNTPPRTDPLPPCEPAVPPVSAAPVVTDVAHVVPPKVLRVVGNWRRRMRRSMQYAAQGNASMALRLRPPDLWLPAESSMTAEALPWDWDLRPLARGEAAVPWRRSGCDGEQPDTGLLLPEVESGADPQGFADQAIVGEMIRGVADDTQLPRGTLLCAPHSSALREWAVARERTSRNLTKRWASEGALPAWPIRACPYGLVDESERAGEPKWRLTNDLSWPQPGMLPAGGGEFVQSHNASMDRVEWPHAAMLRVREVAEAAAVMQLSGAPVAVWSIDCDSFYRVMGRQKAEVWRNAMAVEGGFQLDFRCCFGSAADASKCVRVSNFLVHHAKQACREVDARYPPVDPRVLAWQAERRAACGAAGCDDLGLLGMYVDDACAASFDDLIYEGGVPVMRAGVHVSRAWLHFDAMRATLARFGHKSKASKEQPPGRSADMLGLTVDLAAGTLSLTAVKRAAYARRVREALLCRSMPRREWMRVMGRLQFAAQCYPLGRQWLHAAWRVGRARYRLRDDRVPVTTQVKADLRRWLAELESDDHVGVPLAACSSVPPLGQPGVGAIYADASGEVGWAAWAVAGGELLLTGGVWSEAVRRELIICEKELFASTVGLVTLAEAAGLAAVHSFTDNAVALGAMRNLNGGTPRMGELVAARVAWLAERGVCEAAERVSSKANLWADLGSRGAFEEVVQQAAALGMVTRWVSPVPAWATADYLVPLGET